MKSSVLTVAALGLCYISRANAGDAGNPQYGGWPQSQPTQSADFETWMKASAPLLAPLIPMEGIAGSAEEDTALQSALFTGNPGDVATRLEAFVALHPGSRWRAPIELNLGLYSYRSGYFTRAIAHFQQAWNLTRENEGKNARTIAGGAAAQLSQMYAKLGRMEDLEPLLERAFALEPEGTSRQLLEHSQDALATMKVRPGIAFKCGPLALARVREALGLTPAFSELILAAQSPWRGFSLAEVEEMAAAMQMNFVAAKAPTGASSVPVPSVVHWKQNHYASVVGKENGGYVVRDLTFGFDSVMSPEALFEEASGYFLIPSAALRDGWSQVSSDEAWGVYGRGYSGDGTPGGTGPGAPGTGGPGSPGDPAPGPGEEGGGCGMARYSFLLMLASLHLEDAPLGYSPPVGARIEFFVYYNHRETVQPTTINYGNIGRQWGYNWSGFIEMPSALQAKVAPPNGGYEIYTRASGTAPFTAASPESGARLTVTGTNAFRLDQRDGSQQIYSLAQNTGGGSYRVFLTEYIDPHGNSVELTYDSSFRLITITDSIGQETTLSYTDPNNSYLITKVEDPFGRETVLAYNASGQLTSITDVVGIVSSFTYGSGDFISSLTTPYGTTQFTYSFDGPRRILTATDPLGQTEKVEQHQDYPSLPYTSDQFPPSTVTVAGQNVSFQTGAPYMQYRNSLYWDKKAYGYGPYDPNYAVIYHWMHSASGPFTNAPESIKRPFHAPVFFNYKDQSSVFLPANYRIEPTKTAQVIDVVSGTQKVALSQQEVNAIGKPTKLIDPLGRETVMTYAGNLIDLLEVKQKNAGGTYDVLFTGTYNSAHLPLAVTGADGETTTYSWNAQGQLTSTTNALSETTSYTYDGDGYLQSIDPPLSGTSDQITLTYDDFGRVETRTQWGYTLAYEYDNLNRITKVTYPDATTEEVLYEALHPRWTKDRLGRWTRQDVNAIQQLVGVLNPASEYTAYEWCRCGDLKAIIDAQGNATRWTHNAAGQKTSKIYADGRTDTYSYNLYSGWLETVTDAASQQVKTEYALDGRPTATRYLNEAISTPDVTLTWDAKYPRVTTMVDGTGTTSYTYRSPGTSGAGSVYTIDGPLGNDTITVAYDDLGRVTSRTIDGTGESVTFDTLGRVATVTNPLDTFTMAYSGTTGLPLIVTGSKGLTITNTYYGATGDYRPETTTYAWSGTQVLAESGYQYDAIGRITRWDHQVGSGDPRRVMPGYDAVSRLVSAVTTNPNTSAQITTEANRYDRVGNRLRSQSGSLVTRGIFNNLNQLQSLTAGGEALLRGSLNEPGTVIVGSGSTHTDGENNFRLSVPVTTGTNQLTVISKDINGNTSTNTATFTVTNSGTQAFIYDANGNTTADGSKTYSWDGANRLVRITYSSTNNYTEFSYDGGGRRVRIQEIESGTVSSDKRFVWDGLSIAELRAANGTAVQKRFFGAGFQVSGTSGVDEYFYVKDHLGSVLAVVDELGAERGRWNFGIWGERSSNQISSSPVEVDFGYTGHYVHERSGMVAAPFRFYDPAVARWISRDPLENAEMLQGPNLYAYVANNPANLIDPDGKLWSWASTATGGAIGALGGFGYGVGTQLANAVKGHCFDWGAVGRATAGGGLLV